MEVSPDEGMGFGGGGVSGGEGGGVVLGEDEQFLLECWRHSLQPEARLWGSLGAAEKGGEERGGGAGTGAEGEISRRKPRKGYMRDRVPLTPQVR